MRRIQIVWDEEDDFDYFTITNSTSVTPVWTTSGDPLQYKLGDADWVNAANGILITTTGQLIRFRGAGRTALYNNSTGDPWVISGTGVILSGNLDGLLDYITPSTILGQYAFSNMFKGNASITQANINLPQIVSYHCYDSMFDGCTGLVNAPSLPATTLAANCYAHMFDSCISLVSAPALPATTLVDSCYIQMFHGCTNLLHAPGNGDYTRLLPAQADMFTGATHVETDISWCDIPISFGGSGGNCPYFTITNSTSVTPTWSMDGLPLQYKLGDAEWVNAVSGTSITTGDIMKFRGTGRNSLYNDTTNDPWVINGTGVIILGDLDALLDYNTPPTSLGQYAFSNMFKGNASITQANINLPQIVSYHCYDSMFQDCTSLVNAPSLPTTTLMDYCYANMFSGCTGLVNAPSLPATTLTDNCYLRMFQGCTGLVHVPGNRDYTELSPAQAGMFTGATNVQTDIPWEIIPASFGGGGGVYPSYLVITNSTEVIPVWTTSGDPLQYKLGSADWTNVTSGTPIMTGDVIKFRGTGRTGLFTSVDRNNAWGMDGENVIISGRLDALLDYQNPPISLADYAFAQMFLINDCISNVNLLMPDVVSPYCYYEMFCECNFLVAAAILLSVSRLATYCYCGMFSSCTRLVYGPLILPANILSTHCYELMFKSCSSLVNAPSLPATILMDDCYNGMFQGCTGLLHAPGNDTYTKLLPAQGAMFSGATNVETDIPWIEIPTSFGGGGRTIPYFTITNSTGVTPTWDTSGSPLQYQLGSGDWMDATSGTSISTEDVIRFRGTGRTGLYDNINNDPWVISGTGVVLSGPLNTLLDWQNPPMYIYSYSFNAMFMDNASITETNIIMPNSVSNHCYQNMFKGCTKLVNAPSLPATTIFNECYSSMFQGCTGLLHAPGNNDYTQLKPIQPDMFTGATNVQTDIPWCQIPTSFGGGGNCPYFTITNSTDVTPTWSMDGLPLQYKLGDAEWVNAVSGTSITTGDIMKFRGTGRNSLYSNDTSDPWVINGTGVIISGRLDAVLDYLTPPTSLGDYAFYQMFMNNPSIADAYIVMPDIVSSNCYNSMFSGCSSLLHAPSLPATTLTYQCYMAMFMGCSSLVNAPSLPATTLVDSCYKDIFKNCSGLLYASGNGDYTKLLPAQADMFTGAVNVVTDIPWCMIPVSFGGGGGNCPYFTITNSADVTPVWTTSGDPLQYKLGGNAWTDAVSGTSIITHNQIIRFRGTGRTRLYNNVSEDHPWVISGNGVIISGRLDAVLDYNTPPTRLGDYAFNKMFMNNSSIISVNIIMPNILSDYCYYAMFKGCNSLMDAPSLPATTLTVSCYQSMFQGCTGLVNAPSLPATTLVTGCYQAMFSGCTGLLHAPGNGDYTKLSPAQAAMFTGATNVETDIPWIDIPLSFGGNGGS